MKLIQKVETFDGEAHDDIDSALRYLNKLHADQLSKIAHAIVKCDGKYVKIGNWIDNNIGAVMDLHAIKQDMVLMKDEED